MQHIPTMDIRTLGNIGFDGQLRLAMEPNEEYDVDKWLFVPNTYTEYRYILGTRGENPLICIGINPSTARPGALDPTLKSVERIALRNGFDSFIMFNVYAQRATSPDDMEWTLNAELSAMVHSSVWEEYRRPLEEAATDRGARGYIETRDAPFQPEPFGPRSEKREG